MSKQDRQKLSVLVVLLLVLGLVLVMGYRMNQPQTTAAIEVPQSQAVSNLPATTDDARIRLDLVAKDAASEEKAGDRNIFNYRQAPPPPPPPPKTGATTGMMTGPIATATPPPQLPPAPPPPPPIPLRFEGFAEVNSGGGELKAFLADQARHYTVTVGEILMGRYRVTRISETSVEIEDLEYNRRQSLPLAK